MKSPSSNNENSITVSPKLVTLDQKFICFDVEQAADAKQKIQISRFEGNTNNNGKSKRIAWRIRTNAPTRYIVNPNCGILDDSCTVETTSVELVGNRYNPHHKLVLQAMEIGDSETPKDVWKSQKSKDGEFVQTINFELSTTLMNLEYTQQMANDRTIKSSSSASLASLLEQSSTAGPERIQELEALCSMLKSDTEKIQANYERTLKLKEVLESHLDTRKQTIKDLTKKIEESETRVTVLTSKIQHQESALAECQQRDQLADNNNKDCSIM
jgi:hypothetical protein